MVVGDPVKGSRDVTPMAELVGCLAPRASGGFLIATESGIKAVNGGVITTIAEPEADRPGNRFNDGKCDRAGRFWVGSLAINTAPDQGALWRLDANGSVQCMARNIHVANGLGWSPDDSVFYFTDSGRRDDLCLRFRHCERRYREPAGFSPLCRKARVRRMG
jgi:sugar lactone lactonase YvrE